MDGKQGTTSLSAGRHKVSDVYSRREWVEGDLDLWWFDKSYACSIEEAQIWPWWMRGRGAHRGMGALPHGEAQVARRWDPKLFGDTYPQLAPYYPINYVGGGWVQPWDFPAYQSLWW